MKRKIYSLLSIAKQGLFALTLTVVSGAAYSQQTFTFSYTGAVQTMNLSAGIHILQMWGADGGNNLAANTGGKGGYSTGTVNIATSGIYYIYVGGKGITGLSLSPSAPGGFNGGGDAGAYSSSTGYAMGSGGGASHIASASGVLSSLAGNQSAVVMVAGGGGGSGSNHGGSNTMNVGGHGGGLVGGNAQTGTYGGTGGTQTTGGTGTTQNGTFGQGGQNSGNNTGGGGGGGWYGGGAAQWEGSGGGSGYLNGATTGISVTFTQSGFVPNPDNSGNGYVLLTRLCDLKLTASKNPICEGESVIIGSNAGSNILWNTGATTASITVSPSVTTGYTMSGVSSSSSACSSTVDILVVVNPLPVLTAYSFPPVVCQNGNGTLGASGASTYTWSNGDVGASVIVTPIVSGVYTVTATGANGCVNTETVMMNVNTNVLTVAQASAICKGSTATLTALGVVNALWSNGASFLTIQVAPTTNTVYTVTGVDNLGCTLTGAASVNVLNLPSISIASDKQTVCRGESVVLTANGGVSYVWDNAETTQSVTKTLPVNVPYHYSVTGTDVNGCKSKANITVEASACTGVEEYKTNAINIFPNPVTSELTISGGSTTKKVVVISDIYGKTLIVAETSGSDINVNVEILPAGVYNVQVTGNDLNTIQKFIKL